MHEHAPRPLRPEPVHTADDARAVIAALCQRFYAAGWVSGTGGGVSLRLGDRVFMAPSGVQKEMIQPDWIYELNRKGDIVAGPDPALGFTVSQCRPLFLAAMRLRDAGCVVHSHSRAAVVATLLAEKARARHVTLTHLEMLKGLKGVGYADIHRVPVIDNTAHECDLADSLTAAIADNPGVHAVLVKRHGAYVWGDDWLAAKRHAECYDELFSQAVEMHRLGLDPLSAPR
ncbi:MAG: methylthioribulose 1-phosphate dehydratase [Deltaproteobacteria bacterium]|nr:methylthioribulose 1-phosphate dehydratase [Deltaproteobacteria bacterium]